VPSFAMACAASRSESPEGVGSAAMFGGGASGLAGAQRSNSSDSRRRVARFACSMSSASNFQHAEIGAAGIVHVVAADVEPGLEPVVLAHAVGRTGQQLLKLIVDNVADAVAHQREGRLRPARGAPVLDVVMGRRRVSSPVPSETSMIDS
jgi:hypothetical protein